MKSIAVPAFGETEFFKNIENDNYTVYVIPNSMLSAFSAYCQMLEEQGFEKKEERIALAHHFAAYSDGEGSVFLNYFEAVQELYIVLEKNCSYFYYWNKTRETEVKATITQLELEDFGMSYVIRLSDGRFIVIDGGRNFDPDSERLYFCLKNGSVHEKPIIAAWIMTHPHPDHFHLFVGFMEKYADDVVIEKFMFNFPNCDDLEHYPTLANSNYRFKYDTSALAYIPKMMKWLDEISVPIYTPHTGQIYQIGDAKCEILASMDDTIHISDNINATSLVIRMELCGQVILWAADADFGCAKLPEKYGDHLKADILQVPHHGFQSGTADGEIKGYKLIKPKVCFLPVSDYNAYTVFCTFKKGTRFLMTEAGIDELITGANTRTITLPYTPMPQAKDDLRNKYLTGLDNCGACTWIFTDLNTANPEDFKFSFLNTTNQKIYVYIELFFEDPSKNVTFIEAELPARAVRTISIIGDDVDPDFLYFNWLSLRKQGVPESAAFSARFMSNVPFIVSNKNHRASYYSPNR